MRNMSHVLFKRFYGMHIVFWEKNFHIVSLEGTVSTLLQSWDTENHSPDRYSFNITEVIALSSE